MTSTRLTLTSIRDLDLDLDWSSPLTLTRRHSYSSLCRHVVRLTTANCHGAEEVLTVVSVERPIRRASMTVTNVKYLGQPTTFAITVDPTVVPAMPVTVRLDYDDGSPQETVSLGEQLCSAVNPVASALMHTHTYARFAPYTPFLA